MTMPPTVTCPVCGSVHLDSKTQKRSVGDRFIGTTQIDEVIYSCRDCGSEGDFSNQNDETYRKAVEAMSAKAMHSMLEALSEKGVSMAEFERKLALPQRTTARWKRDGASAAATTLVKTVITYPWLLEVANTNFDPGVANQALMQEGFKIVDVLSKSFQTKSNFAVNYMAQAPQLNATVCWEARYTHDQSRRCMSAYPVLQVMNVGGLSCDYSKFSFEDEKKQRVG